MTALARIERLVKRYPGQEQAALRDVSLEIPAGALFGLLGPNGAGKSTLLSILLGLLPKTAGHVIIDGHDLETDAAAIRRVTGLVPQELAFYPMLTVRENLDVFAGLLGCSDAERRRRIDFAVDAAGLQRFLQRAAGACSGGQQRRLNLALGLLGDPRILCLDEPTVGIDPQSRHYILDVIRTLNAGGVTVIYTSHYLEEVQQLCDSLAVLDHGRVIAAGPTRELLAAEMPEALDIELDGDLDAAATAPLAGVTPTGPARLRLASADPDRALRDLLAVLAAADRRIIAIHRDAVTLEQLYLRLTRKALRD